MTAALAFRTVDTPAFDWRATLDEMGPTTRPGRAPAATRRTNSPPPISRCCGSANSSRWRFPPNSAEPGLSRTETAAVLRALAHYCPSTALALAMHTHPTAAAAWRWKHQKAPTDGLLKRIALRAHPAFDVGRIGLA